MRTTSSTHLCIVRHGESEWNVERRVQGQLDPPLTPLGTRQAEAVAARLAAERWDVLYSSDLIRARSTAAAIGACTDLPVVERKDLRERSQGRLEGLLATEARARFPDWDAKEVGRESLADLRERARIAFEEIARAHQGQRVVVVAHGGLIRQYLEHLCTCGVGSGGVDVRNTALTRLEWNPSCSLLCVNDIAHLLERNLQGSA